MESKIKVASSKIKRISIGNEANELTSSNISPAHPCMAVSAMPSGAAANGGSTEKGEMAGKINKLGEWEWIKQCRRTYRNQKRQLPNRYLPYAIRYSDNHTRTMMRGMWIVPAWVKGGETDNERIVTKWDSIEFNSTEKNWHKIHSPTFNYVEGIRVRRPELAAVIDCFSAADLMVLWDWGQRERRANWAFKLSCERIQKSRTTQTLTSRCRLTVLRQSREDNDAQRNDTDDDILGD